MVSYNGSAAPEMGQTRVMIHSHMEGRWSLEIGCPFINTQQMPAIPKTPFKKCVNKTVPVFNELNIFVEEINVLGKYL